MECAALLEVASPGGGRSLWRISSTLFSHIASDRLLEPIGRFGADEAARAKYPPVFAGEQVSAELLLIKLGASSLDGVVRSR